MPGVGVVPFSIAVTTGGIPGAPLVVATGAETKPGATFVFSGLMFAAAFVFRFDEELPLQAIATIVDKTNVIRARIRIIVYCSQTII